MISFPPPNSDPILCFQDGEQSGGNNHRPPGRPGHCTFRACKPASGLGPASHPASWVWPGHGLEGQETQSPWTELPSPPPLLGTLERAEQETYRGPEAPATAQRWPGQGKELGEILEMPLSPAKTPGSLPGLPAALSHPHPSQAESQAPCPHQPTRNRSSGNAKCCC